MDKTLTVVVLDTKNQPIAGAHVSITPENTSAVTNGAGEVQFKLGIAKKYDITATAGSDTVTVPYYVTEGGATRLVVNPSYVKTVEKQLHQSHWSLYSIGLTAGIGIGVIIIAIFIWKFFKR